MERRPAAVRGLVGALAIFALVAPACAKSAPTGDRSATSPGLQEASPSRGAVPEVLDFTAPLLGGGTLHGADYAGQDVAIWFWAPW